MKSNGYSLIEYCVYLACCAVSALIISWYVLDFLKISQKHFHHEQLAYLGAIQLLGNDLLYAPQDRHKWHRIQVDSLIWKNHIQDVGWYLHNNNLWRITGHYDSKKGTWGKHKKNLIAYHINDFKTQILMKKNRIIGVKVLLSGNKDSLTFFFPTLHGKQCFIS